jgi:hypothetical protein
MSKIQLVFLSEVLLSKPFKQEGIALLRPLPLLSSQACPESSTPPLKDTRTASLKRISRDTDDERDLFICASNSGQSFNQLGIDIDFWSTHFCFVSSLISASETPIYSVLLA